MPLNLDALDGVSRVDVLDQAAVVADPGDEKDDAGPAVRSCDGAHRRDDVGVLALDARGDLDEALSIERLAGERVELAAQAGAQAVARQAREIDGFDDGAVARLGVLRRAPRAPRAQARTRTRMRRSSDSDLMRGPRQAARHFTSS